MTNPALAITIGQVSILGTPADLKPSVTWDGGPLYCQVEADPNDHNQIQFTVNNVGPDKLGPVAGAPFTRAVFKVSNTAKGQPPAQTDPIGGSFGEKKLDFYLRFDSALAKATIHVELGASAVEVAQFAAESKVTTGRINFIAIADGAPGEPNKLVFIANDIYVPHYRDHTTATVLIDPNLTAAPTEQFGPMGIMLP